jgi:hypothetical protein
MTTNQVSDVVKKFFEDFEKDDSPKIVFNLTHEDLMKIMQEHGLLPGKH